MAAQARFSRPAGPAACAAVTARRAPRSASPAARCRLKPAPELPAPTPALLREAVAPAPSVLRQAQALLRAPALRPAAAARMAAVARNCRFARARHSWRRATRVTIRRCARPGATMTREVPLIDT